MLYAFALLWGLFGGSFSATWSGYAGAMKKGNPTEHLEVALLCALMADGRGVGAVISGPLGESLFQSGWEGKSGFAYGTAYGALIVFSSISVMFGGTACVGRLFQLV